jgi:hypothetical protein
MKLIIAGSRTFTDYQLLCQALAPERHRITEVLHGGAWGADQLGFRWAVRHHVRSRRQATCSSPSGMGARQAPPIWCAACSS